MSVTVEFSVAADAFSLGQVLSVDPSVRITLERIVPTASERMPFFWVTNDDGDFSDFERAVRDRTRVRRLELLDSHDGDALYRAEWEREPESLIEGVVRNDGTILEGRGKGDAWEFVVRFPDHAALTSFHDYLVDHDISVDVDRVYTFPSEGPDAFRFDLTDEQREALVMAVEGGYFEVPRGVDLTDIADELGITRQAASERVRRSANNVLRSVLLAE